MKRKAEWILVIGLASVLAFGGLLGLGLAANPSSIVATNGLHVASAASTVAPGPPGTVGGVVAYLVTFTETGLPSGSLWFVNMSGQSSLATTSSTVFALLANGTFSYTVGSANRGFAALSSSFTVSGAPVGVGIGFTAVTTVPAYSGPTGFPLSSVQLVEILVGVSAAIVLGVVVIRVDRTFRPTSPLRPPTA